MANRKSIMHPMVEELRNSSPTSSSSSPLRRRSSIAQRTVPTNLEENDDEAERLARRLEQNQPSTSRNDKRRSLGLGFVAQMSNPQIAERVSQCIKLSAENKINMKNAFSLEMIDFMSYMIKKRDSNMSNLQVASTSLDVSTKIYGFRVDGVHTDILKMISGKDKHDKTDGNTEIGDNNAEMPGETDDQAKSQAKARKKRKTSQKVLASVESLRGNIETVNPNSFMFNEGDSQTTDLLYQAILPQHANTDIYLNPHNDLLPDIVDSTREIPVNKTPLQCMKIEDFSNGHICQSFAQFDYLGWSVDEEIDLTPEKSQASNDALQFDLDASLPPDDDGNPSTGLNYFDMEDDENNENVDRCQGPSNHAGAGNIVDLSHILQPSRNSKNSENSYFQDNLDIQWAGPSHWKIRYATKNQLAGSRIVEGCGQEAIRRKKELILSYNDETINACKGKFDLTRGNHVKLQAKTAKNYWSEEKITLPQDMHYDSLQCCKFYLRPDVMMKFPQRDSQLNATHVSDDIGNYDYNNEHDTTDYCPNIEQDDQQEANNEGAAATNAVYDDGIGPSTQFIGDNLVEAPVINDKIFIPYSQRAKKIDMRQLKRTIWKKLATTRTNEEAGTIEPRDKAELEKNDKIIGTKNFSDVYKDLPKSLSKSNAEALSFPIAFISLLHLANEKNLVIESNDERSDLFVKQE